MKASKEPRQPIFQETYTFWIRMSEGNLSPAEIRHFFTKRKYRCSSYQKYLKSKYIYWNTSSAVCDIPCIKYWQPISAAFPEARFSILFSILNSTTKNIKDVEQRASVKFHGLPLLIIGWFWLFETPMSGRNPLLRCFFLFFDSWTGWTGLAFSF